MKKLKDVTMILRTTEDDNFQRTCLVMNGNSNSFDIKNQEGKLIARINLLETDDYYDIDIIRNDNTKAIKVLGWNDGQSILNEQLPDNTKVLAALLLKHPK